MTHGKHDDRPLDFWIYFQTHVDVIRSPMGLGISKVPKVRYTQNSRQPRVMNRRGYGDLTMDASTARVTLFGFDEDRWNLVGNQVGNQVGNHVGNQVT